MGFEEIRDFYEIHYIDIKKFLNDNYNIKYNEKRNGKGKKWRISHNEIANIPFIAPISAKFSMRYIELVERGKIVVVKDEFGKFQAYINPRLIMELINEHDFLIELKKCNEPFKDLSKIAVNYFQKKYIENKIKDIEETKRLLKHFKAENNISYISVLSNVLNNEKEIVKKKKGRINNDKY